MKLKNNILKPIFSFALLLVGASLVSAQENRQQFQKSFGDVYSTNEVNSMPLAAFEVSNLCANDTTWFIDKSTVTSGKIKNIRIFFGEKDKFGNEITTYMQNRGTIYHIYSTPGDYKVKCIAISDDNQIDTSSINTITIKSQPALSFQYSDDDKTIYKGQSMNISVVGDFTAILWSTGSTEKTITVSTAARFKVAVTDLNNCKNRATTDSVILLNLPPDIGYSIEVVNNIITPNGDGINDYLIVKNLETFANSIILEVYNTRGNIVYTTPDYRNQQFDGKGLVSGTYYYYVSSKGKKGKTGFVDILQ